MFIFLIRWEPRDLLRMNWTQRWLCCSKSEGAFQTPKGSVDRRLTVDREKPLYLFSRSLWKPVPLCPNFLCGKRCEQIARHIFSLHHSQLMANESTRVTFYVFFKKKTCLVFDFAFLFSIVCAGKCLHTSEHMRVCVCVLPYASCVLLHAEGVSVRLHKWISPRLTPLFARSCMDSP